MDGDERVVRGFKLLEVIGRGGMAVVYKAVQTSVNRIVAVKELHRHFLTDPEFIDRFKREATAAANLHHENIIVIHDYGAEEEGGKVTSYIIAMEYVDGRSLKDLIGEGKKIPVPVALNISVQICRGLEHAHARGVIHRDVKPANIMLSNEGYVKIADFGLAQSSHLPSMTVTGTTLGTPAYMSPEQVAGNRKLDGRSDIFSLGVVMYEMVTGQKPFMAETYPAVMTKILTHNPEPPSSLNSSIPEDFSNIIMKCLAKDVDKRYQEVGELLKELQFCAERNDIRIEHGLLKEFVKDPDEFERKLNAILVKQYVDKGLYYMNLGFEKIDDAIDMFTKVLRIQPDNITAKEYLERLRKRKSQAKVKRREEKPEVEVIPEKVKKVEKPIVMKKRRSLLLVYVVTGILFIGILSLTGFFIYKSKSSLKSRETMTIRTEQVKEEVEKGALPEKERKPEEYKKSVKKKIGKKKMSKSDIKKRVKSKKIKEKQIARAPVKKKIVEKKPDLKKTSVEYSYLMVVVSPWADIYIDGKFVARAPLREPIKIPAGEHTLKLINPKYTPFERKMKFKVRPKDNPMVINISLEPIGAK